MRFSRSSGILLHVTSLPGGCGIGDFGPEAFRFLEFLERSGQSLWQVLPLAPTGYGNSPYQTLSAFAGNTALISLERLVEEGWLTREALQGADAFPRHGVDFDAVIPWKNSRLAMAFERFSSIATPESRDDLAGFRRDQGWWLDDYALFIALKEAHGGQAWIHWERPLIHREPHALDEARRTLARRIEQEVFAQFVFHRQWTALKRDAERRRIRMLGDIPIFVAHDSADVWAHQDLFHLDGEGRCQVVAGVPPDYFSETGQLWGNPLYRWDVLAERGYDWWVQRFRHAFRMFDLVRLDHFRGFEAYWEIPGDATDARVGRWVHGPGIHLFRAAEAKLGPLPLIAEDLGLITPEVDRLREELGAPGMRVLQFAFGRDEKAAEYRPHHYPQNCVVYTGTHDNDTTTGWFRSEAGEGTTRSAQDIAQERASVLDYLGTDGREIAWDMIRLAWSSVADTCLAPLQDVLQQGTDARMNLPGTTGGNWKWRFTAEQLTPQIEERLLSLTRRYERLPGAR